MMEEYFQALRAGAAPQLEQMDEHHRDAFFASLLHGYVRLALEFQKPAEVAYALRLLADTVELPPSR